MSWTAAIDAAVDARTERMISLRRRLHANPELSGEERETSLLLYQLLGDEGLDVRMGNDGRGVIADNPNSRKHDAHKCVAIRGDMDALRIHDQKEVEYRSQRDGLMHACGHDAHTSLIWGAVTAVNDLRTNNLLPWDTPLRAIFQPAEETCCGAAEMIEVGALENVGAIFATHMDPTRAVGRIGLRAGVLTASCDEMKIDIVGRGGHAARPHEASDPIAAAAQLINSLYTHIPRSTDSQDAVVVTIGQVQGGDNANVIPEQVILRGTIRTLDRTVRDKTFQHLQRIVDGIAQATDTNISVQFGRSAGAVNNDPQLIDLLKVAGMEVLGREHLDFIPRASMGSEDFAFYLEHVPGAMIRVGCASEKVGGHPLHSPMFDIDEQALPIAAKIIARAAVNYCRP